MSNEIIKVTQLPVIEETLKQLSAEIDAEVSKAKALAVTPDTVAAVKKVRANLTKRFNALEDQRKNVKNAVMSPYNDFETTYKQYVSDKFKSADADLKAKIDEVDEALKAEKREKVEAYFNEYLQAKAIDFVTFEQANINVTKSASLKSLKEKAKAFIDRIVDDLALIETQQHKAEILVEYKKSLNASKAITTVTARYKAIEAEKAREAARIKAKQEAAARREEMKRKVAQQENQVLTPPIAQPVQEEIQPPVVEEDVVEVVIEDQAELTLVFKVTAPLDKLKELKQFLIDGGYKYE